MDLPRFSEMLSSRRRQLGYSIGQASRVLRLREDVLVAFEEGNFEAMPKSGYAQGMLSSYARYLGLDPNEVVDAYQADLKEYQREERRLRRSGKNPNGSGRGNAGSVSQPYVARRGLLPTSGGPAGDMGSFATTRVRTRASAYVEDSDSYDASDVEERYPQGRPYTGRMPSTSRRSRSGSGGSRRTGDIDMLEMDYDGYDDDLHIGRAQPYEKASSSSGRRSSRNISRAERPSVRRRKSEGTRDGGSQRRRSRSKKGSSSLQGNIAVVVGIAVIILISVILVFSISSCVRNASDSGRVVQVSETDEKTSTKDSKSKSSEASSNGDEEQDTEVGDSTQVSSEPTSSGEPGEPISVSVSVTDGSVTWLEVSCDGESDVAQTVTGPWQKTYTVYESMTVQAGDPTVVTVVQDGRQLQFESMASGIGTVRIQGNGRPKEEEEDATSSSTLDGSSTDGYGTADAGANTGSAPMGNATGQETGSGDIYGTTTTTQDQTYGY